MADNPENWHETISRRITTAQGTIRERCIVTELPGMVAVDDLGIHWDEDFGRRYSGMAKGKALETYADDIERVARGEEDRGYEGDLFL